VKPAEKKPQGLKQEEAKFVTHNEFIFGKKPSDRDSDFVDVNNEKDFPTLGAVATKKGGPVQDSKWSQPKFDPFARPKNEPVKQTPVSKRLEVKEESFPSLPGSKEAPKQAPKKKSLIDSDDEETKSFVAP